MTTADNRPHLLFLCHRIPFPPNKGDKIRSFHLLKALSVDYRVHLGAFVDDAADWCYQDEVAGYCESCRLLPLNPLWGKVRSLGALATGQALSIPYYREARMAAWIDDLWRRHAVQRIVVFSSAMAQYVTSEPYSTVRRVIDFVDVDSDKWRQYAAAKPFYSAWIFRREAARLAAFDRRVARAFDVSLFVSAQEAALFRRLLDDDSVTVEHMLNGVDTDYFASDGQRTSPFPATQWPIVFTGAMDYWANVDAVNWFAKEVLPALRERIPEAVFHIVGSRPGDAVQRLRSERVMVTGSVPDVRPYLQHAQAVVAPMHIARGIQNKVLEGMSMARPVVVTGKGLEGIGAQHGREVLIADSATQFVAKLCEIHEHRHQGLGEQARAYVCRANSWDSSLNRFMGFLKG